MYLKFRCCACGHKLKAPLSWAGRRARCPACANTNLVPALGVIRLPRQTRPLPPLTKSALPVAVAVSAAPPSAPAALTPATAAAVAATPVTATPVTATPVTATPVTSLAKDKRFWLRVGSGMAAGALLLTVLALLLPGCTATDDRSLAAVSAQDAPPAVASAQE